MKRLLIYTLWLLGMFALFQCGPSAEEIEAGQPGSMYNIVIVDSCEYITPSRTHGGVLTHKANCKNHRPK